MDLHGLRSRTFLTGVSCGGKQPWIRNGDSCDARADDGSLVVAGLGDHFIHYPKVTSAIDIPPESRIDPRNDIGRRLRGQAEWRRLQELAGKHGLDNHVVQHQVNALANRTEIAPELVSAQLRPATRIVEEPASLDSPSVSHAMLKADEYQALLRRVDDYREYERFIAIPRTEEWRTCLQHESVSAPSRRIGANIEELVGVTRLREVRAFEGFTRVDPLDTGAAQMVPADIKGTLNWLPAAELYGEGVFFTLKNRAVQSWAMDPSVQERTRWIRQYCEASGWSERLGLSPESVPRFIALHTLAHLLMRQMAFECGYPAASLRERLYVSDGDAGMTGVLIYLGAGEPGGSLGGLAELAAPVRFLNLLARSVDSAQWCALDPVCGEHEGRGEPPLNRAACHACCLLPETSCECGNLLLDRGLVASSTGDERVGLFDRE